ncbi:hypothetical protein PM082_022002 [Marasmius tenuissimus]|nr:hypothetical protein PM082_022002 [Marasmius tenuissimus]
MLGHLEKQHPSWREMTTAEFKESIRITTEEELASGIPKDKVPVDYLAPIGPPLHSYLKRPSTSLPGTPSTVRTRSFGKKARPSEGEDIPDERLMLGEHEGKHIPATAK